MQLERKYFRPAQLSKLTVAALLITAFLATLLFAASPSLHEHLHHDAGQPSHQCAITIFEQQQLSASSPNIVIVELNLGVALPLGASNLTAPSEFNYRFSSSRAPPLSLFPVVG